MDRERVTIEAERVKGGGEGIALVHGEAPLQVVDLMTWLDLMKKGLYFVLDDLFEISSDDFDKWCFVLFSARTVLQDSLNHCNYGIAALKNSFPDERDFDLFHYDGEEEDRARKENAERVKSESEDPLNLAESIRHSVNVLSGGLREKGFDVCAMFQDLSAGNVDRPIEAYFADDPEGDPCGIDG